VVYWQKCGQRNRDTTRIAVKNKTWYNNKQMCDKPTLYHSNNTGSKDQHKFIHKLIQCDDIHLSTFVLQSLQPELAQRDTMPVL